MSATGWIGKAVRRVEDARLLTGRGRYIDDHPPVANVHHAAIVRSPHAHARIRGYDLTAALAVDGVVGAITGEDVLRHTKPFGVGVTAPVHYYCAATDKARFVGEPVAVVVAKSRYVAEDAAELVRVSYEPLPAVVDPERALEPDAPVLHDAVGTNLAGHRRLVYGDPDRAFREADVVLEERFRFPKYGSTPIETYGVIATWDAFEGVCTVWSNFMGPFIMHPLTARVLGLPENQLRFIVPPDIGGSFGIKTSIYPYMALIALAARLCGVPVKWIEDRREHLLASSSGTDRVAYRELAAKKDGTILGMRFRWLDNVGGYIRSPEPGCSFRPTGNFVGPYRFQNLEVDASIVMTNKSLTGPNRGYACGHLYFESEGMIDRLADKVGLDPAEVRRRNLVPSDAFPYRTPTGGLYDSGDYQAAFDKALELAKYTELRREQARARAAGRYFGIGLALAVDPSVSNMGYVATALDPPFRAKPEYLPKSGAVDSATVKGDPPEDGEGALVLDQGPRRARPLEHRVAPRGHGARPPGDGGLRLHGLEGGGRGGPRELVEHLRLHRGGDGRRSGPGDGDDQDPPLRHGSRRRDDHQPDDCGGPDLRRRPPRPGRGALRGARLRRGRPAPHRDVHGLPRPDRERGADDRHRPRRVALAAYAARLEGARRVVLDDRAGRHRQRGERRAGAARHPDHGAPDDADEAMEND